MKRAGVALCLLACSKAPPPRADPPIAAPVPSVVASVAPPEPVDPEVQIADLLFEGENLIRCDEILSHESKRAGIADMKAKASKQTGALRDLIVEGKTCHLATSGKPEQASCQAGRLTTYYYAADTLKRSDSLMKECLEAGGSWQRNKSYEAQMEALERLLHKND